MTAILELGTRAIGIGLSAGLVAVVFLLFEAFRFWRTARGVGLLRCRAGGAGLWDVLVFFGRDLWPSVVAVVAIISSGAFMIGGIARVVAWAW